METIFHIDVNSAYLSWSAVEQLKNGATVDLRTVPSIIGGDRTSRHGIVLAKSESAKKFGVTTGEPIVNALAKCPNLLVVPPNHSMYKMYSRNMMELLHTYTDKLEQVSIDECYMDFSDIKHRYQDAIEGARDIQNAIKNSFGFTVNIGISTNKLLAKMASDFEKPNKIHTLYPQEIQVKMWPLPIQDLYMAGKSSVETLKKLEISTIGDLARSDVRIIELHLKSHGKMLWEFANGIGDSKVETQQTEAKGIGNSVTLPKDVTTLEEVSMILMDLSKRVGNRLKKAKQKAGMLGVEIKYYDFMKMSHQMQLKKVTNEAEQIHEQAMCLFREMWNGKPVRLLGIRSSKLVEEDTPEQITLFDSEFREYVQKREKKKKIDLALEKVRSKYGDCIVKCGDEISKGRFGVNSGTKD